MAWRVIIQPEAEKQLSKLDKPVREAAYNLFDWLQQSTDPRARGHGLTGPLKGLWTYRIHGDWRAVAEFQDKRLVVLVLKMARRDTVYK